MHFASLNFALLFALSVSAFDAFHCEKGVRGSYIYFKTTNCPNRTSMVPVIRSQDEQYWFTGNDIDVTGHPDRTSLEYWKFCIELDNFDAHALVTDLKIDNVNEDSEAHTQRVRFQFRRTAGHGSNNVAWVESKEDDEFGQKGNGKPLRVIAPITSIRFSSTPKSLQPGLDSIDLDGNSPPTDTVQGTDRHDALIIKFCGSP